MKKVLYIIAASILSLLISGCGFAPISIDSFSPRLKEIYYEDPNPYKPPAIDFKKRLRATGITLLPSPQESKLTINTSTSNSYTSDKPTSSTQARVYTLTYKTDISITDYNNRVLLPKQTATASRAITLQPDEVFEATPQVSTIRREILQELSIKLLNVLSSKRTTEILAK